MKKNNVCNLINKPSVDPSVEAKDNGTDLWQEMMDSMVKFTEASMELMQSMQDKIGNPPTDPPTESRKETCEACGIRNELQGQTESEHQSTLDSKSSSTAEMVDKSSSNDLLTTGIECHQSPRIIKKKKYRYSSDVQSKLLSQMKKVQCKCNVEMSVDTCLCGEMPEAVENLDSIDRDIRVCSALQTDEIQNIKCVGKNQEVKKQEEEKKLEDTETLQVETEQDYRLPPWVFKPGSNPDVLPQDDSHPFVRKGGGEVVIPDQLIGSEIFTAMKKFSENVAQIDHATDQEETYDEILKKSVLVALNLRKEFSKNDIIGLCTSNHKDRSIPYIAALLNGNRVVGYHRHMTDEEFVHCLKNVTPSVMFVSSDSVANVEKSMEKAGVSFKIVPFDGESSYNTFNSFLEGSEDEVHDFEPYKEDISSSTAVICFTSGTIEAPKAVCLSHCGLLYQCFQMVEYNNISQIILNYSEICHISCILILLCSILTGSTRIIVEKFEVANVWKLIEKYKIKSIYLHPNQCVELSKLSEATENISSLFNIITSGEKLTKKTLHRLREILLGAFIFQIYGRTEMYGITTVFRLCRTEDHAYLYFNFDTCGRALKGFLYKIINVETGMILNSYSTGVLHVKTEITHNGFYVNNNEESKQEEGWIDTGDLAYHDYYGCFHLVGRSRYLIKCRDNIIIPHLIEDIIMSHPSVEIAIVLGIPHDQDGQHPMAFVQLSDKTDLNPDELETMVKEKGYQLEGGLKIIKDLPRTEDGKIRRDVLLQNYLKGEM